MNRVNVLEINYKNYGRCLRIANDIAEIIVSIDFDLRVVKYGYIGGKNHFEEVSSDSNLDGVFSKKIVGHVLEYGTSTKNIETFNEGEVKYELIPCGVRFIQEVNNTTKIQRIMEITFELESSKACVVHKLYSLNNFDINIFISGVSSMRKGGIVVVPLPKVNCVDFPNKSFIFWPYSSVKDSRIYLGEKYVAMKTCENNTQDFRMGFNTKLDYVLYYNNKELFVKVFDIHEVQMSYPNMGCIYEAFISGNFIHMRSNSPVYSLAYDSFVEHREYWFLYKDINLDFIDEYIYNH